VDTITKRRVPQNTRNFLTSWVTISVSRNAAPWVSYLIKRNEFLLQCKLAKKWSSYAIALLRDCPRNSLGINFIW
jgi:hypothetical protein